MLNNERAVTGHNNPPAYDFDILEKFAETTDEFLRVTKKWLSLEQIETEEHASQITDQIDGLRGLYKKVDTARADAKKPHDEAGKAVQAAFKPLLDKLTKAADVLKPKLAAYASKKMRIEAEAKRKAEEAAKRAADEAAERARLAELEGDIGARVEAEEAQKAAEKAQKDAARKVDTGIKSASGAGRTMSLRKVKDVEITNINVLFMHYRNHPDVLDVLRRLATAEVRSKDYDGSIPRTCINIIEREVMA